MSPEEPEEKEEFDLIQVDMPPDMKEESKKLEAHLSMYDIPFDSKETKWGTDYLIRLGNNPASIFIDDLINFVKALFKNHEDEHSADDAITVIDDYRKDLYREKKEKDARDERSADAYDNMVDRRGY